MKKKCFQKLLCCCLAAFVFLGCMDVCGREMSKVQAAKTDGLRGRESSIITKRMEPRRKAL